MIATRTSSLLAVVACAATMSACSSGAPLAPGGQPAANGGGPGVSIAQSVDTLAAAHGSGQTGKDVDAFCEQTLGPAADVAAMVGVTETVSWQGEFTTKERDRLSTNKRPSIDCRGVVGEGFEARRFGVSLKPDSSNYKVNMDSPEQGWMSRTTDSNVIVNVSREKGAIAQPDKVRDWVAKLPVKP